MRLRILLAIVGSVTATLAAFGVPLAWVIDQTYQDDLHLRLERAALAAAPEMTESDANRRPAEAPVQHDLIRVAYYDGAGRFLAGRGPRVADAVVRAAASSGSGQSPSIVALPVSRDDKVIGVVRAEEPAGLLAGRIHHAWLLMAALALAIIATVAGLAAALVRRLAAPVHAMAEAARRLEAGDFAVAPEPSGIRELDTAGVALASAAARLERVLARERALTADITHQLKTPLTALRLELEAGAERASGRDVGAALVEVDRLEATIGSILELARDEQPAREPIAIRSALEATRDAWSRSAHAAGRSLLVSIDPPGQKARISLAALRQILDVLVDNALRHGRGTIAIYARPVGAGIEIDITDDGRQALDSATIFARRSASDRGHGIGLALARSLAEAEGGRLDVASGDGPTTFALLLRGSTP